MTLVHWVLVQWNNGTMDVVNIKAVRTDVEPQELSTGKAIAVQKKNGIRRPAKVVMTSDSRQFLLQQKVNMTKPTVGNMHAGSSMVSQPNHNSKKGYSASDANSRSTGDSSGDMSKYNLRRNKRRHTTSGPQCAPLVPGSESSQRAKKFKTSSTSESSTNSVEVMTQTKCVDVRRSTNFNMSYDQMSQTEYTSDPIQRFALLKIILRAFSYLKIAVNKYGPSIMSDMDINNDAEFNAMFNVLQDNVNRIENPQIYSPATPAINGVQNNVLEVVCNCQEAAKSYGRKRKLSYDQHSNSNSAEASSSKQAKSTHRSNVGDCEPSTSKGVRRSNNKTPTKHSTSPDSGIIMVPLGSGHTVISASQFDQINWMSHTMATRQLLSAVFPRSVLATHSLTGKRAPAFQNLPPKSRLDQRKITDIVMTVTKMCGVKENLVRAAITVKCADENKMKKNKEKREKYSNSPDLANDTNSESWDSDQENKPNN